MAWTASSIIPPGFGQVVQQPIRTAAPTTPQGAQKAHLKSKVLNDPSLMGTAGGAPNPGYSQLGSSVPLSTLNTSGIPSFLANPAATLGASMIPYADILQRIFNPQPAAAASIPPQVAEAYSNAANAAAARTQAQTQAINAALALPGQAAGLQRREQAMAPWSLGGLPTGLGYRDPLSALRNQIFQTNTLMLPNSGVNQLATAAARGSGWSPALPMF